MPISDTPQEAGHKSMWLRISALVQENEAAVLRERRLRVALKECADRLEYCAKVTGNDPEIAASAVQRYRDLLV